MRQKLFLTEADTERLFHSPRVTCGHTRAQRADQLLSLVTFFAAAKKVTAAPHRGRLIDRKQSKLHGKFIHPTVFNLSHPPATLKKPRRVKTMRDRLSDLHRAAPPRRGASRAHGLL